MSDKVYTKVGREEVPFSLKVLDAEGHEVVERYLIVPASGLATRKYREASLTGAELELIGSDEDPEGQRRVLKKMQGIASVESRLVADCCYRLLKDGGREGPFEQAFVEDHFPGDLLKDMFDAAKRISPWLTEKDDDATEAGILRQKAKLDERLKRLKAADPKGQ